MEVLDAERSMKAWEVAKRLGISYRVGVESARFTDPFIARLAETTFGLAKSGLRPKSDVFLRQTSHVYRRRMARGADG